MDGVLFVVPSTSLPRHDCLPSSDCVASAGHFDLIIGTIEHIAKTAPASHQANI